MSSTTQNDFILILQPRVLHTSKQPVTKKGKKKKKLQMFLRRQ